MLSFLLGLLIGVGLAILVMCLCFIGRDAYEERQTQALRSLCDSLEQDASDARASALLWRDRAESAEARLELLAEREAETQL